MLREEGFIIDYTMYNYLSRLLLLSMLRRATAKSHRGRSPHLIMIEDHREHLTCRSQMIRSTTMIHYAFALDQTDIVVVLDWLEIVLLHAKNSMLIP